MPLTVLVVDDEPLARDGMKLLLSHQARVESVLSARNGREAIALIQDRKPDLVLLDVQMPRIDGFAVIHAVGAERMPPVIFVTAHDQYAIRAFEIAAVDYLLKPVTEERFALAFTRATRRLRGVPQEENTRQVRAMLDAIANPPKRLERFAVRSGERTIFVPVEEVEWIEASQNYVRLHAGAATHLLHVPMNTIETVLDADRFLRIHRSYLVNLGKVAGVRRAAPDRFRLQLADADKTELDVARRQSRQLRERLGL